MRVFEPASGRRLFAEAPQSMEDFVAALLAPALAGPALSACHALYGDPFTRPTMALTLLVPAGATRSGRRCHAAASSGT